MTTTSDAARAEAVPLPPGPPVWQVLLVFLGVSALASALLAAVQGAVGPPTDVLVLTQLATAVGALVTWLLWRGRLVLPPVRTRGWRAPLLTSLAVAVVVGAVLWLVQAAGAGTWPPLDHATLGAPLVVVLAAQLVGAAGEEVGWRGLVQPVLETRLRLLPAALVTGLMFGLGHVHVLAAGIGVYALFLVSAVGLSVALAVVTAGRAVLQRVVLATVLHWLVNVVMLVGFSGGDTSVGWTAGTAAATVVAGLGCVLVARARRAGPRPPRRTASDPR
ncbi:CPBP family intramembrane glutamic endopeptidase [Cellulomonas shaoxiangyii]|uniref:CPBP family intramembrane glutamic endopeptidase n=1 Tax=Cellulomonas shaoxiangyii TaxID=2566013 RepID=UPI00140A4318|nr:type II CAAX endopeptidase family protein [Cellulomonas shaoxiangyii]